MDHNPKACAPQCVCVRVCVWHPRMKGEHGDGYRRKRTRSLAQTTASVRGEGQGCAGGGKKK